MKETFSTPHNPSEGSHEPGVREEAAGSQEFGPKLPYDVIDFSDEDPVKAIAYLRELADKRDESGNREFVFHGAHMTGFHEKFGLPEVDWHPTLDPNVSRQPEHPAVYATSGIEGALVHAVLKHRPEDAGEKHGQTFALNMNGGGREVLLSPRLQELAAQGKLEFTDGFLYVLPASEFIKSWQGGNHEVTSDHEVTPMLGIRIGKTIGPELMKQVKTVSFAEDEPLVDQQ